VPATHRIFISNCGLNGCVRIIYRTRSLHLRDAGITLLSDNTPVNTVTIHLIYTVPIQGNRAILITLRFFQLRSACLHQPEILRNPLGIRHAQLFSASPPC